MIKARLVWDGGDEVRVPPEMGAPRSDQMIGSAASRLIELAGRVCYDSLGSGRGSADYHRHILEVGHLSVVEHAVWTVDVTGASLSMMGSLMGRPGIWCCRPEDGLPGFRSESGRCRARVTLNPRVLLDWDGVAGEGRESSILARLLQQELVGAIGLAIPEYAGAAYERIGHVLGDGSLRCERADPIYDEERWVTLYLEGSRGMSHEQVRHGDFTAISQRSTRYVDESESEWEVHPLAQAFCDSQRIDGTDTMARAIEAGREAYRDLALSLQAWLISRGADKAAARKQARGAARGYLGNALSTSMIFSASVAQWRRMIRARLSAAADAEIRELYAGVLTELRKSRYGARFEDLRTGPSPDGVGEVLL